MTPPDTGRALRERRAAMQMTLKQLGAAASVPMRRIQRAEVGEHPLVGDALAAVLDALAWTEADLARAARIPPAPLRRLEMPPEHAARVPAWALAADWRQTNRLIGEQAGVCRQRVAQVRCQIARLGYPVQAAPPPTPPPVAPPPPPRPIYVRALPAGVRVPPWALAADWSRTNAEIGRAVPADDGGPMTRGRVRQVRAVLVGAGCL